MIKSFENQIEMKLSDGELCTRKLEMTTQILA